VGCSLALIKSIYSGRTNVPLIKVLPDLGVQKEELGGMLERKAARLGSSTAWSGQSHARGVGQMETGSQEGA